MARQSLSFPIRPALGSLSIPPCALFVTRCRLTHAISTLTPQSCYAPKQQSPNHAETYASTAAFLLRLLVDDRHVCLVAVARPIPAPAAPLPTLGRSAHVPASAASGAVSPALKSLHLDPTDTPDAADGSHDEVETSSLSSSPAEVSVFTPPVVVATRTRMVNPKGEGGRINNTPATSVFSDMFAERGVPTKRLTLDDLPGPTEACTRKLTAGGGETEVILGVVSAQLSTNVEAGGMFERGKEREGEVSALVDVHLLTLATAPEERGQGLGAKLLSSLHAECLHKARSLALKRHRQIPAVSPLSPTFTDLSPSAVPLTATLERLRTPPLSQMGKYLARTWLEVHPSNAHALSLYWTHGFRAPLDDKRAVKRGFYRGDVRIASSERAKKGGTDAWVMERFDGLLDG